MTSLCVYVTSAYGYILFKRINTGNIVFSLSVVTFSVQLIAENLFDLHLSSVKRKMVKR